MIKLSFYIEEKEFLKDGDADDKKDVKVLRRILKHAGYRVNSDDIYSAWREFSAVDTSSGWLNIGKDEAYILKGLLKYLRPINFLER